MNQTRSQTWVLALTSMASLMVALDGLVVATALSTIRTDLHASIGALEWTVNAYTLSLAVLLMAAARLGDRLGRRRMYVVGLAVFTAASAACAVSGSVGELITARVVQGAGAALLMPLSLALLTAAFPPQQRGRAMGLYAGLTGLAVVAGPVIGGAVAQGLDWHWIFWINVPIGLVMMPLAMSRIPESRGSDTSLDVVGVALATVGGLGVVWALVRGNSIGWSSAEVVTTLVAGGLAAIAFVLWERRSRQPMMPMRLFHARAFSSATGAIFGLTASLFGTVFFAAQFFAVAQHDGPLSAGLRLVPWTATLFIVAPIAGALVNRVGARPLIVAGLTAQAAGLGWIAMIARPDLPYAAFIAPFVLAGAGTSLAMPATQAAGLSAVSVGDIGSGSATFSMIRQLGSVLGIAVVVAVFAATGSYATPQLFNDGFTAAIGVTAAFALAGAFAGLAVPALRRSTQTQAPAADVLVPAEA